MRVLHNVSVEIFSPEDCQIILGTTNHTSKSIFYVTLRDWLKNGLLLSSGEKWSQRRKILTPAFHYNILENFVSLFNQETKDVIKILAEEVSQPVDVVPIVSEFTLKTINITAMGQDIDENAESGREYRSSLKIIQEIIIYRMLRPWLLVNYIYKLTPTYWKELKYLRILHGFTRNIIRRKMEIFEDSHETETGPCNDDDDIFMNKNKKRLAMLDVLLRAHKNGEEITYEGICEEVDTFMFGGSDTVSTAMSFCLMLLANHPHIQDRIFQELDTVLGSDKERPTLEDLQKLKYLDRCIKESLRLYPSAYFISRLIDYDTKLNSGLVLPKGITADIHIFFVHRNPDIYPEPEKFDPDRFLPENCQGRHPYAYIPFSAGPRNCIGQKFAILEMKALLVGIISNFKMKAIDTPDTIILEPVVVLRSKYGIKIEFQRRV